MIEIVRIGAASIAVRDETRVVAVCLRCKGFKTVMETDPLSPKYPSPMGDGVIWVGHEITCPTCHGKGLYYRSDEQE